MQVREATIGDLPGVMSVLDGALLRADVGEIRAAIDRGDVLVAGEEGRTLGALVREGERITAVAVRHRRRNQGIGTELVAAAARDHDRLVAEFDARVRPFWESLGFEIEATDEPERYRGVLTGEPATDDDSPDPESPSGSV